MLVNVELNTACEELRKKLDGNYVYTKDVHVDWNVGIINKEAKAERAFKVYNKKKIVVKYLSNY